MKQNSTAYVQDFTGSNIENYRQIRQQREGMQDPQNTPLYFKDILRVWLTENSIRLKGATMYRYRSLIETHILPELGDIPMHHLSKTTINHFLTNKLRNGRLDGTGGLSSTYVRSILAVISSALHFAEDNGISVPRCSQIFKPSVHRKEPSILRKADQARLECLLQNRMDNTALGIFISLYAGLRIGEICALTWDDIDLEQRLIFVRHTVVRVRCEGCDATVTKNTIDRPKTQSSHRIIPICSKLLCVLKDMPERASGKYVVSSTATFVNPRTYEYRYRKILASCKIPYTRFHILRHTFATRCIEAGVDVKSLSEILGHANVYITLNTYVHSSMEMKRLQLEKLVDFSG